MPSVDIVKSVPIVKTPRLIQLEGIFEVPPASDSINTWSVDLPFEEKEWSVGLIVGPSGSGKTTIAHKLFGDAIMPHYDWPSDKSLVDAFPRDMGIKDIAKILSSVGFRSPPSWVRPFLALSNGEQFRVTIARGLAEKPEFLVCDEFTSVVDRTVAQIASAAVAKAVRKREGQFVAVACHYDVINWLQPDWVYDTRSYSFAWRSVQRHPPVELSIYRTDHKTWALFGKHHYMNTSLNRSAHCFVAFREDEPVAFTAWLPHLSGGRGGAGRREHRTVCLPDYQGIGLGNALSVKVASIYKSMGIRAISTTSNPAIIGYRYGSPLWRVVRKPGTQIGKATGKLGSSVRDIAMTGGFRYIGPEADKLDAHLILDW